MPCSRFTAETRWSVRDEPGGPMLNGVLKISPLRRTVVIVDAELRKVAQKEETKTDHRTAKKVETRPITCHG